MSGEVEGGEGVAGSVFSGKLLLAFFVAGALLAPAAAQAAPPVSVFNDDVPPGPLHRAGRRHHLLHGPAAQHRRPAFDGVPIDVSVAFPPEPASGPDGPYPLIMLFHGYGGDKLGLGRHAALARPRLRDLHDDRPRLRRVVRHARPRGPPPGAACDNGYMRLMDTRYEVRDAQEFAGQLADEGPDRPAAIGAIGGSYGGGMSMALAALKDRKMLPDDSLVPWTSPDGTPMQIAAAAPEIPWTDLAYSLHAERQHARLRRRRALHGAASGSLKQSSSAGSTSPGSAAPGFYAPAGTDPTPT